MIGELKRISSREWFLIIFSFCLLFAFRYNSFNSPFERDEGEYAYSAWILRNGGTLYKDAFLQKPPMVVYTYLAAQTIFGDNVWAPRLTAYIFLVLTQVSIGLIALRLYGGVSAAISMTVFSILSNFPPLMPFAANTEIFMILPISLILYFYFLFKDGRKNIFYFVIAGLLSATGVFYKPICIGAILFIVFYWLYEIYKKDRRLLDVFGPAFFFGLSFILGSVVILFPLIKSGAFPYFWEQAVYYNSLYAKAYGFGLSNFFMQLTPFIKYQWAGLSLIFISFFIPWPKRSYFLFLIFISLLTIYQSPIGHYYLILMPFLAIVISKAIDEISGKFEINYIYLGGLYVFISILPFREQFFMTADEINTWVYGRANPFIEAYEIRKKIIENSDPEDKILIAGSEPEILYYSKRMSSSRFVIVYPMIIDTKDAENYREEFIAEIVERPKLIVYSNMDHSGFVGDADLDGVRSLVNDVIEKDYDFVGGYYWQNDKLRWTGRDVERRYLSLVLYKRK